jgi:hypothetical protein
LPLSGPRRTPSKSPPKLIDKATNRQVLDVVGVAQSVEHYEIARYGTSIAWADELGRGDVVRLLTTNLNEDKGGRQKTIERRVAKGRKSEGGKLTPRLPPAGFIVTAFELDPAEPGPPMARRTRARTAPRERSRP